MWEICAEVNHISAKLIEGSHAPNQVKPTNSKWTHTQFPKVMYCIRGHEVMSLKEF